MLRMYDSINEKTDEKSNKDIEDKKVDSKNFTYDEVLVNLKLIGQLKEDEKLRVYNNAIDIDNRYAQSVMRLLYGDSRDVTIDFISGLVSSAKSHSHKLIDQIIPSDNSNDGKDIKHKLNNLTSDLTSCLNGLDKLKITYRNDHVFRSKIEVIADRIRVIIENNMNRKVTTGNMNW